MGIPGTALVSCPYRGRFEVGWSIMEPAPEMNNGERIVRCPTLPATIRSTPFR